MNNQIKAKKSIIFAVVCALCLSTVFMFAGCSSEKKIDEPVDNAASQADSTDSIVVKEDSAGDKIEAKDLVGTWKLNASDHGGHVTTGIDLETLDFAFFWVEFQENGTAIISFAPDQGILDYTAAYSVSDNLIAFNGDTLDGVTGKLVGGKLLLTRDASGAMKTICALEKQAQE